MKAKDQLTALDGALRDAKLEVYELTERLEAAKTRVTSLKNAHTGVQLAQRAAQEDESTSE